MDREQVDEEEEIDFNKDGIPANAIIAIEELNNKLLYFIDQAKQVRSEAGLNPLLQEIQDYKTTNLDLSLIDRNGKIKKYSNFYTGRGKRVNAGDFVKTYRDFKIAYDNLKRKQKELNFVKIAATAMFPPTRNAEFVIISENPVNSGLPQVDRDKACQPPPYVSDRPSDRPIEYTLQPAYLTINKNPQNPNEPHRIHPDFIDHPNINMIIFEIFIKIYDFTHDNIKKIDRITEVDIEAIT